MIEDPIVIRKSRGRLVVSSSNSSDPIQLVRELEGNKLEVHLKNGSKYIEDIGEDDIQEIILEMMGYGIASVCLSFHAWPSSEEGTLTFVEQPEELNRIGRDIVDGMYESTPYLNSKFISCEIFSVDENIVTRDYGTYSNYDVEVCIEFRARVDSYSEILHAFDSDVYSLSKAFFKNNYHHVCANEHLVDLSIEE